MFASQGDQQILKSQREFLGNSLIQLYGMSDPEEYQIILDQINQGMSMGVCAKNLEPGEVAWRCLDCEKDPTCIICKECFEKSDHTGHRVQLKRNVGGCCDCGDPEAWDEKGFCCDHKGQHDVDPEKVLENMPASIKNSAISVFRSIIRELKIKCMNLQNYGDMCQKTTMSDEKYKDTMTTCLFLIFEFLTERIDECPAFIYIIDENLNKVILDEKVFCKNEDHKSCCVREFLETDTKEIEEFKKIYYNHEEKEKLCTCTTLDLCFQVNDLFDKPTREIVYDFFFKMFQSYHFKQCLTLSFSANFNKIVDVSEKDDEKDLQTIGVQVLTSDEMTMLIFKRPALRDCFLSTLDNHLKKLAAAPNSDDYYSQLFHILHDFKYMARPESLKYCIQETDWIERLIISLEKFYLIDFKKPRTEMISYMQDGQPNHKLLNLEIFIIKLMKMYLKDINYLDVDKNKSILDAFCNAFGTIDQRMKDNKLTDVGFFSMPLHRIFAYYLTRYLMLNQYDKKSEYYSVGQNNFSVQQINRQILKKTLGLKDEEGDQIMSSSLVDNEAQSPIIDLYIQKIIFCLTKYFSFLHEIESRKWVYYGEALAHFPTIYHSQQDRYSSQDLCLMQILLTCDNTDDAQNPDRISIIDFAIKNFGLDGQLPLLLNGLIDGVIVSKDFKKFIKYDSQKMRLQLMAFLRFFAELCLVEVPFLKQIFNRKDEVAEKNHHIQNPNSPEMKKLWAHALKREAVHLLILNKVNTGIRQLKEQMSEIFEKDETFEEMLFEISDQSRDIKNQVTFRLKEGLYPWFDPYLYVSPDQQSLIYQMYEQNQLKDKYVDQGLNDIVGDYLDHYQYATKINSQIQLNLAQSKMLKIICPLLINWLKYKDSKPPEPEADQVENTERERKRLQLNQMMMAMESQEIAEDDPMRGHIMRFIEDQKKKIEEEDSQIDNKEVSGNGAVSEQYDETFLRRIVDSNVGHNCLKLMVLILKMQFVFPSKIKMGLIKDLTINSQELVSLLIKFANSQEADLKMKKLLKFILDLIYKLDQEEFSNIATALGYNQLNTEMEETESQQILPKTKSSVDNAEKVKKKKNKLLAKMKKAGSKYVDSNKAAATELPQTQEESKCEETMICAFCTKEMTKSNFIQSPFGNFGYVQKSKLLYHASLQTVVNQRTVLKNANLSSQFGEEEQKKSHEYCDFQNEDENDKDFTIKKLELAKIISGENSGFINPYTGSGCVITHCKHYAHLDCLRDYLHEQQTAVGEDNTRKLKGLIPGEFNCPICKGINNVIIPIQSLKEVYPEDSKISQQLSLDEKAILDLYVDYLSEILIKQQGFLSKSDKGVDQIKILERSIILKDIKSNPERVICGIIDFIAHQINIVDVKGLASFDVESCRKLFETMKCIVKWVLVTKNDVLDSIAQQFSSIQQLGTELLKKLCEESCDDLDQNIIGNFAIKYFALSDIVKTEDGTPEEIKYTRQYTINQFYKIVRIQVVIAALFRKNNGSLKGSVKEIIKSLSCEELVQFEKLVNSDDQFEDMVVDIELPVMRKMFTIVCLIDNQMDINEVKCCDSNVAELKVIKKQLGIVDDDLIDFEKLLINPESDEEMIDAKLLQKYSSSKFMGNQLLKFQQKVTASSELEKHFVVKMPTNLLLMIPTFEISLYQLPNTFMDLQKEFYKRKCVYCDKMVLDSATCLLTGKTMCWWKLRHSQGEFEQCTVGEKGEQRPNEGLNSWHTRVREGGIGMFLNTSSGNLVLINNGSSCFLDSPYRNKYGEIVNQTDKRFELYTLDEPSLDQIKKKFISFQIPNEILQARTNPDSNHKVYLRNIL